MAAFPLPRPTGALVDLPPVDVDGAQFRVSCAPELARFAIPVLDRLDLVDDLLLLGRDALGCGRRGLDRFDHAALVIVP